MRRCVAGHPTLGFPPLPFIGLWTTLEDESSLLVNVVVTIKINAHDGHLSLFTNIPEIT